MSATQASTALKVKVGLFTILCLLMIAVITVLVNDKPYWWRGCNLVHINVDDATGLKTKSPVRSLGLEIGYLQAVELTETHVRLAICITAPVEVLSTTRGYIRGEGFLGDKFIELKPVKYTGTHKEGSGEGAEQGLHNLEPVAKPTNVSSFFISEAFAEEALPAAKADDAKSATALAEDPPVETKTGVPKKTKGKDIQMGSGSGDVQQLINQVNGLVSEMTKLTTNLKSAIDPKELRNTMTQLNKTLENASKTLSPEGNLNTTAQRTLAKLEDAIEQLRDMMTRVNKGEGSVGMLLNDPSYAEEIRELLKNANKLLNKVSGFRFVVDVGAEQINAFVGGRAWFQLSLWPEGDRYYKLGIALDPRGSRTITTTTTNSAGVITNTSTTTVTQGNFVFTAMLGKVLHRRLELAVGALYGDGALSTNLWLGPSGYEDRIRINNDVFSHGRDTGGLNDRIYLYVQPWWTVYFTAGIDSIRKENGQTAWLFGAGVTFDDEDIKILFSLK